MIEDSNNVPNLDCEGLDALKSIALQHPLTLARRYWPATSEASSPALTVRSDEATSIRPQYFIAIVQLQGYAALSVEARQWRLQGAIAPALELEAACQRIYDNLPSFARW